MPCFHPRDLVIKKPKLIYEWTRSSSGRIVRSKEPISVARQYTIQVPCGKCPACLALSQSQWSFRIEQEALYAGHASTLFVTYTYDNENLPEDFGLHKEEMQRYLHDLRQNISRRYFDGTNVESLPRVRYYICGEYGSKRGRPHFHAILFLSRPVDWTIIQSSWGKGIVDIRPFTPARAGYVAKYSVKQLELDYEGRPRPFHMQSQGLGACFLEGKSFHTLKYNTYFRNSSGRKVKLPRYYLDKLGTTRNYYRIKDMEGNVSSVSFTHHSFWYDLSSELGRLRHLEKEAVEMTKNNFTYPAWLVFQNERSQKLEHELLKLQKQSSYYVKTDYESRTCSPVG